jgi:hypothetical protein
LTHIRKMLCFSLQPLAPATMGSLTPVQSALSSWYALPSPEN